MAGGHGLSRAHAPEFKPQHHNPAQKKRIGGNNASDDYL
jgi:hypothetical protein